MPSGQPQEMPAGDEVMKPRPSAGPGKVPRVATVRVRSGTVIVAVPLPVRTPVSKVVPPGP